MSASDVDRSKRVCRQFLEWCESAGHITDLPPGAITAFKAMTACALVLLLLTCAGMPLVVVVVTLPLLQHISTG